MVTTNPERWVDEHGDCLFRYALIRVRQPAIAEDLVQETFLAAMKAQERFAGQSSERSWLVGILKHKIIDHIRKVSRERPAADEPVPRELSEQFDEEGFWRHDEGFGPKQWADDASVAFERKELWGVLEKCLGKLPPRTARAFVLREMEGLDGETVCKVLGISPTNFWVLLHRARTQLRHCLEMNWFGTRTT